MTQNCFGIHTSNTDYPQGYMNDLLSVSGVVKVLVNFNDAGKLHEFRSLVPHAFFIGRYINLDLAGQELFTRYYALQNDEEAKALGTWYANQIADLAIATGLTWLYWEAGPNEMNDTSSKAVAYALAFMERMRERGLKAAVGNQSYGRPQIPPFDANDEWLIWRPVFQKMDEYNRDSAGNAYTIPNVVLQLHEYIKLASVDASIPYAICRYRAIYQRHIQPYNWWVPIVMGELGYATDGPGDVVPATEVVLAEISHLVDIISQDPYVMGFAWWDFRAASAGQTGSDWNFCAQDMIRTLCEKNYTQRVLVPPGPSVPPDPPDPPDPGQPGDLVMKYPQNGWVNIRQGPGTGFNIVGMFLPSDTAELSACDVSKIGQSGQYAFINGTSSDSCLRGWCAAWLLKVKE